MAFAIRQRWAQKRFAVRFTEQLTPGEDLIGVYAVGTGKGGNGNARLVGLLDDGTLEVEWMTLMTAAWRRDGRLFGSVHDRCCVHAEKVFQQR